MTFTDIRSVNLVLKLRDRHTILEKWVDVKSAVPIAQMKEVVQHQLKVKSQKTKHIKGNEVLTQAILTFPGQEEKRPIHVPVLMQMPSDFF